MAPTVSVGCCRCQWLARIATLLAITVQSDSCYPHAVIAEPNRDGPPQLVRPDNDYSTERLLVTLAAPVGDSWGATGPLLLARPMYLQHSEFFSKMNQLCPQFVLFCADKVCRVFWSFTNGRLI